MAKTVNSKITKSKSIKKSISKYNPKNKYLITAALPYANGPLHLGHMLEYIQADIYARFLRLIGKEVLYICASDMHGTPIEVNARKAGITPEKFVDNYWNEHKRDFSKYLISFDNYYKTHSPENKELSELFFNTLKSKGFISLKNINVIYCNNCNRSLPDRFVRGTCPNCTAADQYGDTCEHCGSALKGTDLINPKCVLCLNTPIQKESLHYFFNLGKFTVELKKWMNGNKDNKELGLQSEVKNWLDGWMKQGLEDWCISRDEPYFGFEIPNSEKETGAKKYFYVWMDAPIGYISSTKNYCDVVALKKNEKCTWQDYWHKAQVQHFIGKDISYFHFLFWPAMLIGMGIPLPRLTVHGWITVDGQKMSKSRGTFFTAQDFLKLYPVEALRFYYAQHLDRKVVDIDINFKDFIATNNNVLAGNLGNFCYRVLTFAEKNYSNIDKKLLQKIVVNKEEKKIIENIEKIILQIKEDYSAQNFKQAIKNILVIADIGNAYFQKSEVWKDVQSDISKSKVNFCVNISRNLGILISPILPDFSKKVNACFNNEDNVYCWKDISFNWSGKLNKVDMLVTKIDKLPEVEVFPLKMVVGEIKEVKNHPNADSLYILKVSFGDLGVKQVVAGLKKHIPSDGLLNKKAVFCYNMQPAKIRGENSEAMIFAADDGIKVGLLEVDKTAVGDEVFFTGMKNNNSSISFEDFKKLRIFVQDGKVEYDQKKLASKVEDVKVFGIKNGAAVQ